MPVTVRRRLDRQRPGKPAPWEVTVAVDGQRRRKAVDGRKPLKYAEAVGEEIAAELEAGIAATAARQRRGPAFVELMNAYWLEHGQFLASAASESSYQSAWADAIGDGKRAAEITQADIAAAVAGWRQRGAVGSSTINHYLGFLQRVWRRVPLYRGFRVQPIEWKLLKLDEPEPPDRSRTEAELRAYLDALPARSIPITLWSLFTGLRRSALLRLTRPDLDFERGIINAVSKGRAGGKPTPVAMSQPILAVMAMYPVPAVGRIFAVTKQMLRTDREKAREKAGLPDFRFHDLRHTFAQTLEDAGYGDTITAALHHSSPALRSRYSRARLKRTEAAIDAAFATRKRHHV